tara:strand:+ start:628 stop:744 length:117 start_codon:yes stop_codon:yes gene_type:complete
MFKNKKYNTNFVIFLIGYLKAIKINSGIVKKYIGFCVK